VKGSRDAYSRIRGIGEEYGEVNMPRMWLKGAVIFFFFLFTQLLGGIGTSREAGNEE